MSFLFLLLSLRFAVPYRVLLLTLSKVRDTLLGLLLTLSKVRDTLLGIITHLI